MDKIAHAASELREMDELAALGSLVHRLNPLVKLLVTITYIFVVASFEKYDFSGLIIMLLYPVMMFQASGIRMRTCFYKLRIVMPLVCAVGLFNPFFDKEVFLVAGPMVVTGGIVSMITLMLKGVLCLMASFILMSTTSMDALCGALRKLHVPGIVVTLLLLTYRYIAVMIEEVGIMTEAYHLRAPGQKGIHHKAWGSFLGQLLLRSMDKAEELYSSMQLRGFSGEFRYAETQKLKVSDYIFGIAMIGAIILCRVFNAAQFLGGLFI